MQKIEELEMEQISRERELKKMYKDKDEKLTQAMNQLEIENMQLRREKEVLRQTMACDEESKILENRMKIIEEEREHYMQEIKKWKEEVIELIKQKESIEKENCRLKE